MKRSLTKFTGIAACAALAAASALWLETMSRAADDVR